MQLTSYSYHSSLLFDSTIVLTNIGPEMTFPLYSYGTGHVHVYDMSTEITTTFPTYDI